ncbi:MAG: TldD/PmbA family protein, partial [Chloroflexi bacterium]|nr:TldD/PmbA family protein [Chloroflexota bacterium]
PGVDHWDAATAEAEPSARAGVVGAFVRSAGGLDTAGFCETTGTETAFVGTSGQRLAGRATQATVDGICRTLDADGSGRTTSRRLADVDGAVAGTEAARRARYGSGPTDLEPGRYEVVLEPACVMNLLLFLSIYGFNGRAVEEGRSFVRLGEPQFDSSISLRDDVTDALSIGLPFDVEGTPRRRLDLVTGGVTSAVCHDRRTATAAGTQSTGHAVEGGATLGAVPANLILAPGSTRNDQLVAEVERGLLVTDFWYTRILDPRTQVVTGLTRNGVWLIEAGRVVRPVKNLRFTQSYVEALASGQVKGIGSALVLTSTSFGLGAYAVPPLHLASWNFTGGARG